MIMKVKGFTLIELLVVVSLIGIIAAIVIPNLMAALHKGKQKASIGDMKTIGTAIEAYMVDTGMAPGGGAANSIADVEPYLASFYLAHLPTLDGWSTPFYYQSGAEGVDQAFYSIFSYGRDKTFSGIDPARTNYIVDNMLVFDNDICFSNGMFTYTPKVK
jgi:general secretion pathway protein G